ncbi:hypothetical protein ABL78_7659 [Leptomonas seymouri]|uniref:RING-CH-type domain-containing protein n=1 Tax=Leptomonas seymouri TaxID=5684 RepID=A0A0N0P2S8_LEPSE|nr:hypothetical protein ABL78_7659 [Leptomonas seymouri]|eukprot:KPI83309.1 hypothetical protein ABL78_7659 [Leptomonas seymouri]
MTLRHWVCTTYAVLVLVVLWMGSTDHVAAQGDVGHAKSAISVAQDAPSPQHQTTVLNRLWWRNLEEQDVFIQRLFQKPLATASIGMLSGAVGSDGTSPYGDNTRQRITQHHSHRKLIKGDCPMAHHAPANSTGPEKRRPIPHLHMVYTITRENNRALEVQAAASASVAARGSTTPASAKSTGTSYAQLLRSVLPLSLGVSTENEAKPLTPLQAAALHSPITPLRAYVLDYTEEVRSTAQGNSEAARASPADEVGAAPTANREAIEHPVRTAKETAVKSSPTTAADQRGVYSTPLSQEAITVDAQRLLHQSRSFADETLVVVGSITRAVVPLKVTGTRYTIVQFDGKAGHTINAVVQLKDHRYNKSVSPSNCKNMHFKVELRNHVMTNSSGSEYSSTRATVQPHAYIDEVQWSGAESKSANAQQGEESDDRKDSDTDISTATRGSWANFWDSFALMLDTSALCKVLPSVSMRVSRVQHTEPFYVVLRSTTGYAYGAAAYYNTTHGAFYTNTKDDDYTCELDLFIEQWPAAEQERMQFIYSFVVPLLVLLLPLPLTMRRADLVQQYMMEEDYGEWVWRPPYYLCNRMSEGLKTMLNFVVRLRTAHQQRALLVQLQRQRDQQPEQAQPAPAHIGIHQRNHHHQHRSRNDTRGGGGGEAAAAASFPPVHPLSPSTEASQAVTAGALTLEGSGRAPLPRPPDTMRTHVTAEPSEKEDEAVHRACIPRAQFKETASTASTTSSDGSHLNRASTGSTSGSDFDDDLDGRYPRSRGSDQGDCRSRSTAHPGAVSPPNSLRPRDARRYPDGPATAGNASSTGPIDSVLSLPPPLSSSEPDRCSSYRCHHRRRRHDSTEHSGASRAVSVHVPLSTESPVVSDPRRSHGKGYVVAHDLLFTIPDVTDAERGAAGYEMHQPQQPPSKLCEEVEAGCRLGQPMEGREGDGTAMAQSCTNSTPPTAGPMKAEREGGCEGESGGADRAEETMCRICREGNDVAPLIAPCGCTGSVGFVHASCLDRWRLESAKRNLANVNHCEICKMPFTVNIQRSTLLYESSQQMLRCICLFVACFLVVVLTTTLTHGILGELSCLAYYHEVAYSTMFRFEGLSLSLFIYGLAVLLVLFGNLIVYSWFRGRREVEEYVEEMHTVPPFYTRRNMILTVLVCSLLLAQVHATGFLMKYVLYNTSRIVWTWETSPLVGGMLFALFTTCSITVCSWGRQMYMLHLANRGNGQHPAEDVVVEDMENSNGGGGAAPTAPANAPPAAADVVIASTSTAPSHLIASSFQSVIEQNRVLGRASSPQSPRHLPPHSPITLLEADGTLQLSDQDVTYTSQFQVPPDQRVIRAFEYCPPHRKTPK